MRAYGIYARVVGVSENSLVRYAHSFVFWYKNECVNTVQSTFHAVICLFYTYWDFSTPTRFSSFIRQNKYQVMFSFRPSASTSLLQILVQIFFIMFTSLHLRLICFPCLALLLRLLRAFRHFLAWQKSLSSKSDKPVKTLSVAYGKFSRKLE